jgi:HAD superfamily hydrolase (TIGR01509 family)
MKAVIFDFDGLVVDTETPAFRAWSGIYQEHGAELALADWVQCVGSGYGKFDPVKHLEKLTGIRLDDVELKARKDKLKAEICETQPLMPGVSSLIQEASELGVPVAIASSSGRDWIDFHARRTGILDLIRVICTREDVRQIKPAPDLYLLASERLGVSVSECIVFEDSQNGVAAARAAGMIAVAVPNMVTAQSDFSTADLVLQSLADTTLRDLRRRLWPNA